MAKLPIPKNLKDEAGKFVKLHSAARDKTNEANRQKTAFRNAVKSFWKENELPHGSFIRLGGHEFTFAATETDRIDMDRLLSMYEEGEITREAFLDMVKADMAKVRTRLGGDAAADLTVTDVGNKADIRMNALPVENIDDEYIEEKSKVRIKRRAIGKAKKKQTASPSKQKRRIKVKK